MRLLRLLCRLLFLLLLRYAWAEDPVQFVWRGEMLRAGGTAHIVSSLDLQTPLEEGIQIIQVLEQPGLVADEGSEADRVYFDILLNQMRLNNNELRNIMQMGIVPEKKPPPQQSTRSRRASPTKEAETRYEEVRLRAAAGERDVIVELTERIAKKKKDVDGHKTRLLALRSNTTHMRLQNECRNRCIRSTDAQESLFQTAFVVLQNKTARVEADEAETDDRRRQAVELASALEGLHREETGTLADVRMLEDYLHTLELEDDLLTESPDICDCPWDSKEKKETFCSYMTWCKTHGWGLCNAANYPEPPRLPKGRPWTRTQGVSAPLFDVFQALHFYANYWDGIPWDRDVDHTWERANCVSHRRRRAAHYWHFGHDHPHRLDKRQIVEAIGLVATVVSTISGWYTSRQLDRIQTSVAEHDKELDAIVYHLKELAKKDSETDRTLRNLRRQLAATDARLHSLASGFSKSRLLMAMVAVHTAKVARLKMQVQAALDGRFPLAMADAEHIQAGLDAVKTDARKMGYYPAIDDAAQALELRASFIFFERGVSVILHLPLVTARDHLQLHRLEQVPQPLDGHVFGTFHPAQTILAISKTGDVFRTLSAETLQSCQKLGRLHWCDDAAAVHKTSALTGTDNSECLVHLFRRQQDLIKATCPISLTNAKDMVIPLTNSKFLAAATKDEQCTVTCGDKVTYQGVDSVSMVTLEPGCRGSTSGWEIAARYDFSTEVEPTAYSWPKDFHQVVAALQPEGPLDLDPLHDLVDEDANTAKAWEDLPLGQLQRFRQERLATTTTRAFGFGSALVALLWLALASAILIVLWRRWKDINITRRVQDLIKQVLRRQEEEAPGLPLYQGPLLDPLRQHLQGLLPLPAPPRLLALPGV